MTKIDDFFKQHRQSNIARVKPRYRTLNNKVSKMIVCEALKRSYLAYVHLYAHRHFYSESAFCRLCWVVSCAYPLYEASFSGKLNPSIEWFFMNYKYIDTSLQIVMSHEKTV